MFIDIVNFTTSPSDDAHAKYLIEKQSELLRPIFTSYRGHEVRVPTAETEGAGLKGWLAGSTKSRTKKSSSSEWILEFTNALDAASCAIDVQRAIHEYNRRAPASRDIHLRIGMHLGEIEEQDGELLGEGVSVASRITLLSHRGEIYVSGDIWGRIKDNISQNAVEIEPSELDEELSQVSVYMLSWQSRRPSARPEQELETKRIAVLPFVNMSPDPQDEYFADGLTEELIDKLCHVRELEVIARTSVMSYKKKEKKAAEIGRELKVGALVEGSVRKAGNRIRVTAQLINANTEAHLWSSSYDRNLEDIFAVQSDIAEKVAGALKLRLLDKEREQIQRKEPTKPEAYVEYLRGLYFWHKLDEQGLRKAVDYFEKALELEPSYAAALAGLSRCWHLLGYFGYESTDTAYPKGIEFASKALKLDETIPEAHLSTSLVEFYRGDWAKAEMENMRALQLNPNFVDARIEYSMYLADFSRFDEAIIESRKALDLDPLSLYGQIIAGDIYTWAGRYSEALFHFDKALELDSNSAIAHNDLGNMLVYMGKTEEGLIELERAFALSEGSPFFKANLGFAYGVSGRKKDAFRMVDELKIASTLMPLGSSVATAYAGLGEKYEALNWLEKAYEEHSIIYQPLFTIDPVFASLREEPRFRELIKKMGLDKYQGTQSQ